MSDTPQTWHHGLVARVWAERLQDAGEHDPCFRRLIEAFGQPVLDAACGAGRLLVPWLADGIEVDGSDVSAHMLEHCRQRAAAQGLKANLYLQALHEIDLPRHYRTIVMCGAIGLGGDRDRDQQALRRCFDHLDPGGCLALDSDVPWASPLRWSRWRAEGRGTLPEDWPPPGPPEERGRFDDGSRFEMGARTVAFDPLSQVADLQMRVRHFVDGEQVAEEVHALRTRSYFRDELVAMLELAGFEDIQVRGGYGEGPATDDDDVHLFVARRGE